ncbi:DUF3592 domain-containing protein [Streptomyces sp. NPDC002589]|uniref:DUF3592 domain-containing protein n=1 Tax=Streptomyces sp. NPDC002589 TaxID=3154420 RepID=UPI003320F9C4
MRKKKKKKRPQGEWKQPPKSAERQAWEAESRRLRSSYQQPKLPQRRLIAALFATSLACFGAFLVFLLPSQSLVSDLRSRGVATWATVTSSPRDKFGSPGNITVRFDAPKGEIDTTLSDWGSRRPDGLVPGNLVSVTYDPHDPTRVLTTDWVRHPPTVTFPMLVTLVMAVVLLAGATLVTLRRRALQKAGEGPESAESPSERKRP